MALVNKYDVYNKIIKVINSCKNHLHIIVARQLINNFEYLYKDKYLIDILNYKIDIKRKLL